MTPPSRFDDATFATYRTKTASQEAALDAAQAFVERMQAPRSLTDRLRQWVGGDATDTPQGVYFVGPVGTGKTHLLAAIHHALTPAVPCAFLHSSALFRQTASPTDYGNALADRVDVCCLDEVEIDDPANEARLVRTLQVLEARGVHLAATSNVKPERFLSNQFGPDRFRRFLHTEFRARYRIVVVEGEDHRRTAVQERPGHGWIGPPAATRSAMQAACQAADGSTCWLSFAALREATTSTAHRRLIDRLTAHDRLFIEHVKVRDTDDALRLLRVIDALYLDPDAPALFFTAETPPEAWFAPSSHRGVAQAIAEKFTRTVSRLRALCDIDVLNAPS
jgi:cell division protein ZapE